MGTRFPGSLHRPDSLHPALAGLRFRRNDLRPQHQRTPDSFQHDVLIPWCLPHNGGFRCHRWRARTTGHRRFHPFRCQDLRIVPSPCSACARAGPVHDVPPPALQRILESRIHRLSKRRLSRVFSNRHLAQSDRGSASATSALKLSIQLRQHCGIGVAELEHHHLGTAWHYKLASARIQRDASGGPHGARAHHSGENGW